jgi:hypothetical protein
MLADPSWRHQYSELDDPYPEYAPKQFYIKMVIGIFSGSQRPSRLDASHHAFADDLVLPSGECRHDAHHERAIELDSSVSIFASPPPNRTPSEVSSWMLFDGVGDNPAPSIQHPRENVRSGGNKWARPRQ